MIELFDTKSSDIAAEFVRARRRSGSPAMGMIMTLVIVADEEGADEAMTVARSASREHPARILGVVIGDKRGASRVDAQVGIGSGVSGERALIKLSGEVTRHPQSVVLPLLLPDSPVVVWWPSRAPDDPGADPLGALGTRRITDAASVPSSRAKAMLNQCASYAPGNTDLSWTRITGWRALLAAALDQQPAKVLSASVTAERISPSADLLSAWLGDRLRCDVTRKNSDGPGITSVVLTTKDGDVRITRFDGRLATLTVPGEPDRPVALKRRDLDELLSEELRRLDPDDVYAATVKRMARTGTRAGGSPTARRSAKKTTGTSTTKSGGKTGRKTAKKTAAS
jgi:glucose-6-phosphate dehydrogenase assembly protein OpcA